MNYRQLFRTAGVTTEQVVSARPCFVHGVRPEVASTAGTITLRNATVAELVGTPGTVTGTPDNAGGVLTNAHGPYFAKVVAVDVNGQLSAGSVEQSDTIAAGATGSIAYTWAAGTGAAPAGYRVYFGSASGVFDRYFEVGAGVLALTVTANAGGVALGVPGDTAAATSGDQYIKTKCAVATLQAGKKLDGAHFDRGLVVQLSNTGDLTSIIWETGP